jgi:hypothetical protein
MATTPLWVPFLIAALGVVGTLAGVLFTQHRADRRETTNWDRERTRERERWAREDEARTFEHRREAYVEFYESLRDMAHMAYDHGMGLAERQQLGDDWQLPTYRKLQHLEIYATPAVKDAATTAYSAAWWWGHNATYGKDNAQFYEQQEEYDVASSALLDAIRADLGVPDDDDHTS